MIENHPNIVNDSRLRKLAQSLYSEISSSKAITHLGLFESRDSLDRPSLLIYLKRIDQSQRVHIPSFVELSLALRPDLFLDLLYDFSPNFDHLKRRWTKNVQRYYAEGNKLPPVEVLWMRRLRKPPS